MLHVPATRFDEDPAIELLTKKNVYALFGYFNDFPIRRTSDCELDYARAGVCGRNKIFTHAVLTVRR